MPIAQRSSFDPDYLKELITLKGFDDERDFLLKLKDHFPETALDFYEYVEAKDLGMMNRQELAFIGAFLGLSKEQFLKFILAESLAH